MSQIPQRRATRATRALPDENATRKLVRPTTRSSKDGADGQPVKETAATTTAAAVARGRSTLDAAAQKRKRDALGEVTNGKPKPGQAAALGKGKERAVLRPLKEPQDASKAGPPVRASSNTTTNTTTLGGTRVTSRLRTTSTSTTGSGIPRRPVHIDGDINEEDADAMTIDEPHPEPAGVRHSSVTSQVAYGAVAPRQSSKQLIVREAPGPRPHKQIVLRDNIDIDEEEELRAHKKRRTSSEADELERLDREREIQILNSEEAVVQPNVSHAPDEGWEDLDAEDADDPLMVAEYVVDIFDYLKSIESTTMPNPTYMNEQTSINWAMRGTLVDWMISVHTRFRFLPETLFLAVNILDRFLSMRLASVEKLQLVGATALFVASKTEEMFTPGVKRFVEISDNAYTETELLNAEKYMLKIIEWNLSYPNPINFLRRVSKADEYNIKVRTLAKFFCEIGVLEWKLLKFPPSLLAAAAMWLGRLVLGQGEWTVNLIHYSSYTEDEILPVANTMVNYILRPMKHENFWKKYASKKFYKCSNYIRDWATSHWQGTIRLSDHVAALRAEAADQLDVLQEEAPAPEAGV